MAGTGEKQESSAPSSAGVPGPLSRLLRELANSPGEAVLAAWREELKPGDRLDRFEIRRVLGRGGFGAVYEAIDSELGRVVAIKTLRPGRAGSELASAWIKMEAEAIARLNHPGIVTLFDVCNCASGPYLVMELLEGKTLAERLSDGPLPSDEALRVAEEVARALAHAHGRGVLHRDLKPANVFLCEDGRVKLLDFGLAHLLGKRDPDGSGTPGYMAPEQERGEEIDARADVFAAAVTLRETLTGQRAQAGPIALPRALALPLQRALSANREGRPRDGTAWLQEVVAARAKVRRPRQIQRASAIALGAIALAGGLAYATWRHGRPAQSVVESGAPSIAVLPFADMSPGKDHEYLSDGVAEEILNSLARIDGLRVVGRTSSWFFKGKNARLEEIGRELHVGSVLEGSVRREGSRLRVTAKLLSVPDGRALWSETYDRELGDVFALQEGIAGAVARALRVKLLTSTSSQLPRTTPDAYLQYLLGYQLWIRGSRDDVRRSVEAFERALAIDPNYAPAWAGLAWSLDTIAPYQATTLDDLIALKRRAMEAADRAVERGPDQGRSYYARGGLRAYLRHEWREALADLDHAIARNGNDSAIFRGHGWLLAARGRLPEAITSLGKATELEPLAVRGWMILAYLHVRAGEMDLARQAFRRVQEMAPDREGPAYGLALTSLLEGRAEEALAVIRSSEADEEDRLHIEALAEHSLGHDARSRRALDELRSRYAILMPFEIASAYAWRGERDAAFEWLDRCDRQLDSGLMFVKRWPLLRDLRADPRWSRFLQGVNLPVD